MTDHDHAAFEAAYWGDCTNTFDEEQKHYVYADYMGIPRDGYAFDAGGKSVLDIGGGPVSMLLKCKNRGAGCVVIDPLMGQYPTWVQARYALACITNLSGTGEHAYQAITAYSRRFPTQFDEVWIYNVLQHTDDPALIIKNAGQLAPVLRIFEWIDVPPHEGHPQMLTARLLDEWRQAAGFKTIRGNSVVWLAEHGCFGSAYYGTFSQ